jgi:hypothetical protein
MIDHLSSKDCAAAGVTCPAINAGIVAIAASLKRCITDLIGKTRSHKVNANHEIAFLQTGGFQGRQIPKVDA